MAQNTDTTVNEWREHWPLLLAATIGLSFVGIPTTTLGLFMEPLQNEFGWSRTTISFGLTVFAILSMPLSPFGGAMVDRFGARAIAIPGLILSGLFFASFSLMDGSVALWIAVWVFYSAAAVLIRSMVWNPPISMAFVKNRALAMGVLLCGMTLSSAFGPLVTHTLIEAFGWRAGYIGLGIGWAGIALLLVIPFFRVKRVVQTAQERNNPAPTRIIPGGLSGKEALKDKSLVRVAIAGFLGTVMMSAYGVHMVPIYTSLGLERGEAASMALLVGIVGITSKLVVGSIADRVNSSFLPLFVLAVPALGYAILLGSSGSIAMAIFGALVVGVGSGALIHVIMYLTTQYGGLKNFGKIYGSISGLFGLAAGIGPVSAGIIFDNTGGYEYFLMAGIPVFILSGLLVFGLGPYPKFPSTEVAVESEFTPTPVTTG